MSKKYKPQYLKYENTYTQSKYKRQSVRKDDQQLDNGEQQIDMRNKMAKLAEKRQLQIELRDKMDKLAVQLDYRERARRRAEIPKLEKFLLSDEYQQSIIEFRNNELNKHKEQWIIDKAEKDRLAKILAVLPEFEKKMLARQ